MEEVFNEYADSSERQVTRTSPALSDASLYEHEVRQRTRPAYLAQPESLKGYQKMKVAMIQTAAGLKPPSGGFRGNYASLFALAKHGHKTMQTCWAFTKDITETVAELREQKKFEDSQFTWGSTYMTNAKLEKVKVTWWKFNNAHGVCCVALDAGVMLKVYPNELQQEDAAKYIETGKIPERALSYVDWLKQHLTEFDPTHVVFNDALANIITHNMPNLRATASRVEIVHTLEQLPVGPFAGGIPGASTSPAEFKLLQDLDGIVAVSMAVQKYAKKYCDLECAMIPNHAWAYKDKDTGDWPRYRKNFAKQNVVMINPALVKGYDIFLGMASLNKQRTVENNWDALLNRPVYNFIAYSSWGSKPGMVKDLEAAGVKMLHSVTDMEPAFDNISVLVMPSIWQEAWGLIATEAQLRGIPVIASRVGGLREAKRYVEPFIDVNPIDGTKRNQDGSYVIPEQEIKPWMEALDSLLNNEDEYEAKQHMAYYTTREWVRRFDVRKMEKYFLSLMSKKAQSADKDESLDQDNFSPGAKLVNGQAGTGPQGDVQDADELANSISQSEQQPGSATE